MLGCSVTKIRIENLTSGNTGYYHISQNVELFLFKCGAIHSVGLPKGFTTQGPLHINDSHSDSSSVFFCCGHHCLTEGWISRDLPVYYSIEQFCFPFLSVQGQVVFRLHIWWSFVFVLSTVTHTTLLILLHETGPRCCDGGQPTSQALQTQRGQSLLFSFRDLSFES